LEFTTAPETEKEQRELEKAMGFSCRQQAVGDLIFALTVCRPDTAIPVIIKLLGPARWRKLPHDEDLPDVLHPHGQSLQRTSCVRAQSKMMQQRRCGGLTNFTDDLMEELHFCAQEEPSAASADVFQQLHSALLKPNLPAWLMLEKQRFAQDPSCLQTRDSRKSFQRKHEPTTEAWRKWQPRNSQHVECNVLHVKLFFSGPKKT
jgi:hypothetical protein